MQCQASEGACWHAGRKTVHAAGVFVAPSGPGLPSDCFMCGPMCAGMLKNSAGSLLLRRHVQSGTSDKWAFHYVMRPY